MSTNNNLWDYKNLDRIHEALRLSVDDTKAALGISSSPDAQHHDRSNAAVEIARLGEEKLRQHEKRIIDAISPFIPVQTAFDQGLETTREALHLKSNSNPQIERALQIILAANQIDVLAGLVKDQAAQYVGHVRKGQAVAVHSLRANFLAIHHQFGAAITPLSPVSNVNSDPLVNHAFAVVEIARQMHICQTLAINDDIKIASTLQKVVGFKKEDAEGLQYEAAQLYGLAAQILRHENQIPAAQKIEELSKALLTQDKTSQHTISQLFSIAAGVLGESKQLHAQQIMEKLAAENMTNASQKPTPQQILIQMIKSEQALDLIIERMSERESYPPSEILPILQKAEKALIKRDDLASHLAIPQLPTAKARIAQPQPAAK